MAKRAGTTRRTTHYEDEVIEDLDVKAMLEALLRKKGTRSLMEAYAKLKTKKDWREARKKLVPLADVILAHKALYSRSDQAQIRAAELLLLYAGEKPAERLQHAGEGGGPIESRIVLYRLPENGRDPVKAT